jgi:hypothetical protein
MLRIKRRKSRGRPEGHPPVFLSDCVRLDATALLAKSRGARFSGDGTGAQDFSSQWALQWTDDGRPQHRTVALSVTTTRQPLGGVRRWWRCPGCRRRCRVLVAISHEAPIGCRLCLGARYETDYQARSRRRRFVALVHAFGAGALDFDKDAQQELAWLLAPRRRGVRRGRRVHLRAVRALVRRHARLNDVSDILQHGGL